MSSQIKISVVIASYNHERYIYDAIKSVAEQTHGAIELIVIDDFSSDSTYSLIREAVANYSGRFGRVVVKQNSINRGAPFSLSRGISISEGHYVALLNSDDMFTPDRLDSLLAAAQESDAQFLFSEVETIDDAGALTLEELLCQHVMYYPHAFISQYPSISWALLRSQLAISSGNFFFSRSLATKIGAFAQYHYCHDWDYILRASWHTEPVFVKKRLYKYRIHGSNSFKSLSGVADMESKLILKSHMIRALATRPSNVLFPSLCYWPDSFFALCRATQVEHIYKELYDPYLPYHRTLLPHWNSNC